MLKGRDFTWHICRIDRLLSHFCSHSPFFKGILQRAVAANGPVLTLCTYADEATPGDAFAPDNLRKSWCIYVSVMEFGAEVLCREEAWLPLAILRSSVVTKIDGGLPCVFRVLLRSWFCGEPLRLSVEGIMLELEERTLVTFHETLWIKDLDGFRAGLGWRGSSSLRPCFKCRNCMKKGHPSCSGRSWQVDITCTDEDRFDLMTDDDLWEIVDLIKVAHDDPEIERGDVKRLVKAHGFNHVKNGRLHNTGPEHTIGALDTRFQQRGHWSPQGWRTAPALSGGWGSKGARRLTHAMMVGQFSNLGGSNAHVAENAYQVHQLCAKRPRCASRFAARC